jgi:hypothetical protein
MPSFAPTSEICRLNAIYLDGCDRPETCFYTIIQVQTTGSLGLASLPGRRLPYPIRLSPFAYCCQRRT